MFILKILQISDLQEKQKRSNQRLNTDTKVKEVKKIANAKLKSCAEILQVNSDSSFLIIMYTRKINFETTDLVISLKFTYIN